MEENTVKPRALVDSRVLISGGTSGVGLAAAIAFAEAGTSRIAIMGRNTERGRAARERVLRARPNIQVEFIQGDATDAEQAQRSVDSARRLLGGIDVLVNTTHGGNPARPFHKVELADIASLVVRSTVAPMHMGRAVLPSMMEQRTGAIINLASDSAKTPTPGGTILGAAMAAIAMFSRTLAMEAKRYGIRVNVLTPALISGTPMYEAVMADAFMSRVFAEAARKSALGHCTPEDLAALIVFLASPSAARLTGQAISVNGGMSAA